MLLCTVPTIDSHQFSIVLFRFSGNDESLGEFAPKFLWLLRDFYLKLEEEGHKVRRARWRGALVDTVSLSSATGGRYKTGGRCRKQLGVAEQHQR